MKKQPETSRATARCRGVIPATGRDEGADGTAGGVALPESVMRPPCSGRRVDHKVRMVDAPLRPVRGRAERRQTGRVRLPDVNLLPALGATADDPAVGAA
jgi:hypothetical protein